jgi:hypothetical protein
VSGEFNRRCYARHCTGPCRSGEHREFSKRCGRCRSVGGDRDRKEHQTPWPTSTSSRLHERSRSRWWDTPRWSGYSVPSLLRRLRWVLFGGLAKDRPIPDPRWSRRSTAASPHWFEPWPSSLHLIHQCAASGRGGRQPQMPGRPGPSSRSAHSPGRLVTMQEVADATDFLLRNSGVNAQNLIIDGGLLAT